MPRDGDTFVLTIDQSQDQSVLHASDGASMPERSSSEAAYPTTFDAAQQQVPDSKSPMQLSESLQSELDAQLELDASTATLAPQARERKPASTRYSRHGTPYTPLPKNIIKKMAIGFCHANGNGSNKLNADAFAAIAQASDWFFEQASIDLRVYSKHAGRKTIEESDVIALMARSVSATVIRLLCDADIFF